MRRWVLLAAAGASLALAVPAQAQSASAILATEQAGLIGERYDGYLGYVTAPPPGLRRQVDAVNIRRRSLYYRLASAKGVSPQEVGITAACQLLARVGVGQPYLLGDNVWRKRGTGEAAPVPDYCG